MGIFEKNKSQSDKEIIDKLYSKYNFEISSKTRYKYIRKKDNLIKSPIILFYYGYSRFLGNKIKYLKAYVIKFIPKKPKELNN